MQADLEKSAAFGANQAQQKLPEDAKPTPNPTPGADAEATPAPVEARPIGVSEEAFRALHQLSTETPPALKGEMVAVGGGQAYLSLPEGKVAPMPAVVVIHEWWGLNDHIKHWADRLAAEGYAALAVDLYGGKAGTTPEEAQALMKAVDPAKAQATLAEAYAFLAEDARIKAPRRASIGWCFGGGWSLQLALAQPEDAAVIYYGRVVTDPEALTKIHGKLLGIFANQDQGIPPKDVDAFEAALKEAGVDARILRYDAQHAFANPSSARYDAPAAEAAWAEVQAFLRAELKP
ncbi:MAG: dienelactone hydrolase family protein [Deltaproteobacteria bacterium]|nr:dienelactone hydrolase family protein [Deltaproteobacteria bacterium]